MVTTMAAAAALIPGAMAALAALFAVVSLASSRGGRAELGQPAWYPLTILVIGVAGALAGGWVRLLVVAPGLPPSP